MVVKLNNIISTDHLLIAKAMTKLPLAENFDNAFSGFF